MSEPLDSILANIDKGNYLAVLIGALSAGMFFLWRQNVWLTKEIIRVATASSVVLEKLLSELQNKGR